jgi:RNA polymerase sigma factor (sigma-70 family)
MVSTYETNVPCAGPAGFPTTHWSVVLTAGGSSLGAQNALEGLCRAYWHPVWAYARRQGRGVEEAQDLTQDFFARLLSRDYLQRADPERGRFRSFLLTAFKRFLINDWQRGQAAKRGGGQALISWDEPHMGTRLQWEPADPSTPEMVFEKQWAVAVLERVLEQLGAEFTAKGDRERFERLKVLLWGEKGSPPLAQVAEELGLSEGALKVALHRLRQRFRDLLRAEVAQTVAHPQDVDDELRHLIAVVSG